MAEHTQDPEITEEMITKARQAADGIRDRAAALLLAEYKKDEWAWYYVSCAGPGRFHFGYFCEARGPTEAWMYVHSLNWFPLEPAETRTYGPFSAQKMARVPKNLRWVRLTAEQVKSLD